MIYNWEDLPERKNCLTVRNAAMINLNTGKIVRHYSSNTRINVVQKCITPDKTYYRTAEAAHHYLNYAFEASAFGLPNEKAPSAPSVKSNTSHTLYNPKPTIRTPRPAKTQKSAQKSASPKGGEERRRRNWFSKIFRRKK